MPKRDKPSDNKSKIDDKANDVNVNDNETTNQNTSKAKKPKKTY